MACLDLEDIIKEGCADNEAGLASKHYYARLDDILTFPVPPNNPATFAAKVTAVGNFVMKPGKAFKSFYCTLEKGELTSEMVGGARDGKSFQNLAAFYHPGSSPSLLGFMETIKNDDVVVLVKELNGQIRIIGQPDIPANLDSASGKTGMAVADEKGFTFTLKSIAGIAPVYTGVYPVPVGV
jgi:hypothetical protein